MKGLKNFKRNDSKRECPKTLRESTTKKSFQESEKKYKKNDRIQRYMKREPKTLRDH